MLEFLVELLSIYSCMVFILERLLSDGVILNIYTFLVDILS